MIAVIADDLTGAAELAGIGLRYGLQVEMSTVVNTDTNAELLVISTDTRSVSEVEAWHEMATVTRELLKLKPDLIFKKVDSVLRGHVLAELTAQLEVLHLDKALLVPANPALDRTISKGTYYYKDQPIHLSSFSHDPEFAINSSDVLEMLRAKDASVVVRSTEEMLPASGIIVGEVTNSDDLKKWSIRTDENTLAAGASGLFTALLDTMNIKGSAGNTKAKGYGQLALFVCGSTFNKSREAIKRIKKDDGPVSYMPEEILRLAEIENEAFEEWGRVVSTMIKVEGRAIISIDEETTKGVPVSAGMLREKTAMVVNEIFKQVGIQELFIEGGSTAAAVIKKAGFKTFFPLEELAPGVIRMSVKEHNGLCVTVKPGSYEWPKEVWKF